MKKANLTNFLIITIIFVIFYVVHLFLSQNDINIYLQFNLSEPIKVLISVMVYILLLVSSVLYASWQVFKKYIKHLRSNHLVKSRNTILISSILVSYLFLTFEVEYYYYFGSIIILYMIYFISLFFYDSYYIKKSQETKVVVNDEVVEKFLALLGGKENIISVSYEYSRLKVELKDIKVVKLKAMKDLGAKGAFVAGNKLQAVIGNNASELENAIKTLLSTS